MNFPFKTTSEAPVELPNAVLKALGEALEVSGMDGFPMVFPS